MSVEGTQQPEEPTQAEQDIGQLSPMLGGDDRYGEAADGTCERCGLELEDGYDDVCAACVESIEEQDELNGDEPEQNDGFTTLRGTASRAPSRRTWAAKEPYVHGTKKRVLYGPQGVLDHPDEDDEDDEMDSVDDGVPNVLGYLDDFPGLTTVTKISTLRAGANFLSSQMRASKPFKTPVKRKVREAPDHEAPPLKLKPKKRITYGK